MGATRMLRGRGIVGAAVMCLFVTGCESGEETDETGEEDTGEAVQAIFDGTEDTGDAVRNVFYTSADGQCSGTLIGPQTVVFTGHCAPHIATGCDQFTFNQTYAPAPDEGHGYQIIIPPPGSASYSDPLTEHIPIDGVQVHPGYAREDYVAMCCAGGDPVNCTNCAANPSPGFESNKMHDMAVVHLSRPVTGITPSKVLLRLGSRATSIGRYPVNMSFMPGRDVIIAGSSATTQHPSGRWRAYAKANVTNVAPFASDSPTVTLPGTACSSGASNLHTLSAGFAVHLNTQLGHGDTDGGCPIPGDSGGPVFFNFTALGGTAFPAGELLSTDVLLAGVDSAGAADPTNDTPDPSDDYMNCPGLSPSRYTASWDFTYTLTSPSGVAKTVAGNNGTFIGARLKDFDGDGVFDVDDNCVVAPNPEQANCNADAETAKGYPRRGDACDPIPCPAADTRDAVTTVLSSTNNGNGFATKTVKAIRDQIDVKPLASSFYGNGAGQARLRPSVGVGSVTTKYRYCQPDLGFSVTCNASAIGDNFVDVMDAAPPDSSRPYHKARMIPNPGSGSGQDNEALGYTPGAASAARRWKYLDDYNLWSSSGWITPTFGCSIITGQCYTNLNGRFWSHAATTKGRYNDQVPAPPGDDGWAPFTTGYRVNNLGNASSAATENGSHLANNYILLEPDAEKTSVAFTTSNQIVTYLPWWCDITPKWDGVVGERSPLIAAGTSYAIMMRDGTAQVVDSYMTSSARTLLGSTSRVAAGAEVMREQGFGGFQAVAFSSTGTNLTNVLGITTSNLLGAGSDLGFSVSTTTGPAPRTSFSPAYSRYDDLAFVVGGTLVGGGDAADIWMRQVKGTLGWTNITPSGLGLKKVLAATYSFRDGTLWVLDENTSANTRRLIRVSPFLSHAEVVYTFTKSAAYTKQWLVLDVDGNVVLASSGTSSFGIARFQSAGLNPTVAPTILKLEQRTGELLAPPTIDAKGNTLVLRTAVGVPTTTERRTSLQGSAATYAGLDAIL